MSNINLETMATLMELRNKLDAVAQASWSFSFINKEHPIEKLSQTDAEQLVVAYQKLLDPLLAIFSYKQ